MSQPKRKEETLGKEMSADEAIAYVLKEYGIKVVHSPYYVPNVIKERFKQYDINFKVMPTSREAIIMADSFARLNNELGVALIIPGFYVLEAMDIIALDYQDSIPLLIISSVRNSRDIGKSRIAETRTQDDLKISLSPFVKTSERVTSIEEITQVIEKGYKEALSNRPRPVLIEIGEELFRMKAYPLSTAGQKPEKKTPDKNTVAKAAEVLLNSKNPVIIAGYGVLSSSATDELIQLAELLDCPVITTIRAKGAIPARHPLFAGEGLGLLATEISHNLLTNSDTVLAIGTRFPQLSLGTTNIKFNGFIIHNNIDGEEIGKVVMPHLPVVADTKLFLRELLNIIKSKIKEPINRGVKELIKSSKKIIEPSKHEGIWPVDVLLLLLNNYEYSKVGFDISAPTLDLIRLPINTPGSWITTETMLDAGIGITSVLYSNDEKALAITSISSTLKMLSILQSNIDKIKGKILILNDDNSSYIDTTKSESIQIIKSGSYQNYDTILERTLGAITVKDVSHLKEALLNESKSKVINVKISYDYNSIILRK
ncbi:MAG: thiamine pyrophosphate-binding protein [Sulfolobaceae archaeon]